MYSRVSLIQTLWVKDISLINGRFLVMDALRYQTVRIKEVPLCFVFLLFLFLFSYFASRKCLALGHTPTAVQCLARPSLSLRLQWCTSRRNMVWQWLERHYQAIEQAHVPFTASTTTTSHTCVTSLAEEFTPLDFTPTNTSSLTNFILFLPSAYHW